MDPVVAVLVAVGALAVVPLGLRLLRTPGTAGLVRAWPAVALPAVAGLLLPRGALAVLSALPYAAATAAVGALAARRAVQAVSRQPVLVGGPPQDAPAPLLDEVAPLTAGLSLATSGAWLLAERAGVALLGFPLEVVALTVAHFTFAGFAAALLAGLGRSARPGAVGTTAVLAVPAGTALVAVGHLTDRAVELAGTVVITTGVLATSLLLVQVAATTPDRVAAGLLHAAAAVTPVSMALALVFALGRLTGLPHPSFAVMGATHGALNALGLCLCGLLAWTRLRPPPL